MSIISFKLKSYNLERILVVKTKKKLTLFDTGVSDFESHHHRT